jgi:hypothetical protein
MRQQRPKAIYIILSDYERADIHVHSMQAMVGGLSDIFTDNKKRKSELRENQLIGFAAEAAFFKWAEHLGSGGIKAWMQQRVAINEKKWNGDGGVDCVLASGTEVDIKCSEIDTDLNTYSCMKFNLTQCETKTLKHVAYVQCFAKTVDDSYQVPREVLIVGWLWGHELDGRKDFKSLVGWSASCRTIRDMNELKTACKMAV